MSAKKRIFGVAVCCAVMLVAVDLSFGQNKGRRSGVRSGGYSGRSVGRSNMGASRAATPSRSSFGMPSRSAPRMGANRAFSGRSQSAGMSATRFGRSGSTFNPSSKLFSNRAGQSAFVQSPSRMGGIRSQQSAGSFARGPASSATRNFATNRATGRSLQINRATSGTSQNNRATRNFATNRATSATSQINPARRSSGLNRPGSSKANPPGLRNQQLSPRNPATSRSPVYSSRELLRSDSQKQGRSPAAVQRTPDINRSPVTAGRDSVAGSIERRKSAATRGPGAIRDAQSRLPTNTARTQPQGARSLGGRGSGDTGLPVSRLRQQTLGGSTNRVPMRDAIESKTGSGSSLDRGIYGSRGRDGFGTQRTRRGSGVGGDHRAGVNRFGGFHYRGDHVQAGIFNGRRGLTAYYQRSKDHGPYYDRGYFRHGSRFGFGLYGAYSNCGEYYLNRYYPYGYHSYYDSYYYRYPYHYGVSVGFSPTWVVYSDPVETVYVESPRQTVYVETPEQVVYVDRNDATQGGYGDVQGVQENPNFSQPDLGPPQPRDDYYQQPVEGGEGSADLSGQVPQVVEPQDRIPVNNELLAEADGAFRSGRYVEARDLFAQAVLNDPYYGFAQLAYGLGHFASGEYEAAAGAIRRGLAMVPDVIDRPVDITRQYGQVDDFKQHVQNLRSHVAANPGDGDAWFVLGYVLFSSGQPQEAAEALQKASAIYPDDAYAAVLGDVVKRIIAAQP